MILYRLFLAIVILLSGYLIFDSARIGLALSYAQSAEESQIIAPENGDTDLIVVEYLDYNCQPCRNLHPLLSKAIQDDSNVKFIPRPISPKGLDDPSANAAKLVYAAAMQGKMREAHNSLMEEYRVVDQNFISNFSLEHELDSVRLEQDMNSEQVRNQIQDNVDNLTSLNGQILPALLVNGKMIVHVNGPLPSSTLLQDLFDRARTL